MGKLSWFALGVVAGLTAAAVGQELQKPPEQRSWTGTVAGMPYNFRLDEWGDIAGEYWNPESSAILAPKAIGIGWGINFAAVAQRARELVESQQQHQERTLTEHARR